MPRQNEQQNILIARLEERMKSLEEKFDNFISNEFHILRQRVDWILWIFILGTLISIVVSLLVK